LDDAVIEAWHSIVELELRWVEYFLTGLLRGSAPRVGGSRSTSGTDGIQRCIFQEVGS
jgi:hypothetical protein